MNNKVLIIQLICVMFISRTGKTEREFETAKVSHPSHR